MKNSIKILVSVLFFAILYEVQAQQKIDSLLKELKTESPKKKLDIHLRLCYEYADEVKVLYHAKMAHAIATQMGDSLSMVKSGRLIGRSYRLLNHLDSAIEILRNISPIAERNDMFEYGRLQNSLGMAYAYVANYSEALKCHFESLAVMEKIDNKQWISISLFNMGLVYYKIEDTKKALEYYERAYKLKQTIRYKESMDVLLINIGLCYTQLGDYSAARKYVEMGLAVCSGNCSGVAIQGEYALGIVYFMLNKMEAAEAHFLVSFHLSEEEKDIRYQFDNIIMLSKIYQATMRLYEAEQYLRAAEILANEAKYNLEVIKLYKQFFLLYSKKGDLGKVAFYQEKYIHLKDSVYDESFTNKLMRVQAEYLERENKEKIAAQQQLIDLKDKVIVRQTWLTALAGIAGVLLIIVVYILYKSNNQRKIVSRLLDEKIALRIAELESNYGDIQRKLEERKMAYTKTLTDIRNSVATLKDLSSSGTKDSNDTINHALEMDILINNLSEILRAYTEGKRF
jgi:tetratricopeptide (TPR) repeat protein